MKFYYPEEDRVIETEELIRKFGTDKPIPQLGIFPIERIIDDLTVKVSRLTNYEKESS